jgi:hypothetical protein
LNFFEAVSGQWIFVFRVSGRERSAPLSEYLSKVFLAADRRHSSCKYDLSPFRVNINVRSLCSGATTFVDLTRYHFKPLTFSMLASLLFPRSPRSLPVLKAALHRLFNSTQHTSSIGRVGAAHPSHYSISHRDIVIRRSAFKGTNPLFRRLFNSTQAGIAQPPEVSGRGFTKNTKQNAIYRKSVPFLVNLEGYDDHVDAADNRVAGKTA